MKFKQHHPMLLISKFLFIISLHSTERVVNLFACGMSASKIQEAGKSYLVYGTAWKKDESSRLVMEAIESGFRFIDTACQPKHYNEKGVGDGWRMAAGKLGIDRKDLYLQTKFTSIDGQDPNRIPYDKHAKLEDQVKQSFMKSLENLHTDYLDALVMHGPMSTMEENMRVWRVFESFYDQGKVKKLGVSNFYDINHVKYLYEHARIKPSIIQNRFYSETNFDTDIRQFCKLHQNITYQSFWTLTANRQALSHPSILELATKKKLTPQTLMYAFMLSLGYATPLDGTTSREHMMQDVAVMERILNGEQVLSPGEMHSMHLILGVPQTDDYEK